MSDSLDILAEEFSPHGNIGGRGIAKILGTPKHDRLQVLVRETVQNSWDAARDFEQPVTYRFGLRTLTDDQHSFLRDVVLSQRSPNKTTTALRKSLNQESLRIIEISDHGTTGLGGPTEANDLNVDDELTDFIDFVRNIGAPRDKEHGGGTYGYGKTSLYAASRCATIVVYTCCLHKGMTEQRLIVCRLGDPFTLRKGPSAGKYTGRYWWGKVADKVVKPVTGMRAQKIASGLGVAKRSPDELGTTILILDPSLEERSPEQAIATVHETLLWTFWPKMLKSDKAEAPVQFEVELDGKKKPVPSPDSFPPLNVFVDAMKKLKSGTGIDDIGCDRPKTHLGKLALSKYPIESRTQLDTGSRNSFDMAKSHHVALMRPAELVVKYLAGPELNSDKVEYGGVFICDKGVEHAFAAAEPPAHDDWIYDYLQRPESTYVRQALKRIKNKMMEFSGVRGTGAIGAGADAPLGLAGDSLGGLLLGQSGPGLGGNQPARRPRTGTGNRRSGQRFRVSQPEFIGFSGAEDRKTPAAMFRMIVEGNGQFSGTVTATPAVQLEGGSSTADPSGVDLPRVLRWTDERGNHLSRANSVSLDTACPATIIACVSIPDNCALALTAQLEANQ